VQSRTYLPYFLNWTVCQINQIIMIITFLTKFTNFKKGNDHQDDRFMSLLSCSSTGALRLKLNGYCHECVAECATLSTSRVRNDSQTKTRELVHFVALRSNWFYFVFEYITTYATTTSVFIGTTFGEAVGLTTIFSHQLCTNVS